MTVNGPSEGNSNYPVSVAYTIRKGDNLETISKATGIPVSILAKDNNIKDPNNIKAGESLWLNYHPEPDETFNSTEMNEMFPNMNDQARYFEEMDNYTTAKYNAATKEGAQEYVKKRLDTKW